MLILYIRSNSPYVADLSNIANSKARHAIASRVSLKLERAEKSFCNGLLLPALLSDVLSSVFYKNTSISRVPRSQTKLIRTFTSLADKHTSVRVSIESIYEMSVLSVLVWRDFCCLAGFKHLNHKTSNFTTAACLI